MNGRGQCQIVTQLDQERKRSYSNEKQNFSALCNNFITISSLNEKKDLTGRHDETVPMPPQELQTEQDLQLWNEIDDACSAYLSIIDPHPETSNALEELCFMVMGYLQKPQSLDEKDNTKRFLFHYAKSHDSGNSDLMSSVLHPLLQLVPQLHERRLKRYKADEDLQGPTGIQSRGYFLFRPRNGRRSAGFR
ncbi:neuromedin-U [Carettochelys insculpta]|uniref:neuromedin-U n=1 Tax=Carettochelys insculpta TaxID=44489 RepID=UPI003EBD4DFA